MSKTVSRSGENGESTPVAIPYDDGVVVEHKADPKDIAGARSIIAPNVKGFRDEDIKDWIENLMDSATNFSSPKGSFKLAARGLTGSVQMLPEEIRKDPYILRAVQRDKIRFLTEDEARDRIEQLQDETDTSEDHLKHLMEALDSQASERDFRYKIDLPDDAEPKRSLTVEEIWASSKNKPESPKNFKNHVAQGETEFTI